MQDKMDNDMQKYYSSMNSRNYPPPPFPSLYPPSLSTPPHPPPYPSEHYLPTDKSKMQPPYNDYYKNPPYYPPYPPSKQNQPPPPPFPLNSHQKSSKQPQSATQNSNSPIYPMGMQPNAPYPYGYPYYSYPGMPYPYGMYPSYYYNRSMGDMYPGQSSGDPRGFPMNPGMMPPPPYFPPIQPHFKNNHSPIVKQEIVISSDEEKDMHFQEEELGPKQVKKQTDYKNQQTKQVECQEEKKEKKPQVKQPTVGSSKQIIEDNQTPFEIKRRKRIVKDDKQKVKPKKEQAYPKKPKDEAKITNKPNNVADSKDEALSKKEIINFEKERISGPLDSKQNMSSQRIEPKKNFKAPQSLMQSSAVASDKQDKKAQQQLQEKQNQKKEKLKDDHPLKELRYSESHGRIRIGNYYQSNIPDLLFDDRMLLLRKELQERLKEREISAITF